MTTRDGQDLGWRLRLGWGVGSLGASTLINGVTFLALFYFTRVLGIEPALAGTLLFLARLFDIVTDPLMGIVSDRVRSPLGRRRPFLLAGAVVSSLAFVAIFNPPAWSGQALATWCAASLLLYAAGFTLFIVPYLAMPAEMTQSYHERSRLMSARVVFASLGLLTGGALAPALAAGLGGGRAGYAGMSLALAALIGASMLACYSGTRGARFTQHVPAATGFAGQVASALQNRPFAWLLASKLAHLAGVSVSNTSLLFVVTTVLGRPESAAALFGLTAAAGTMLSMPGWLAASRRFGKRNTYVAAVLIYLPVLMTWLAADPSEPSWMLAARGLAVGLVTGGLTLTAQAMLPDTIEHDARRTGLRREASLAAVYSAVEKTAAALGPLLLGLLLTGPGDAAGVIRLAAAWLPAVASALSALLLIGYRLDRDYHRKPS
jgi:GPH family glycoside/pentoside/hexuronide:cation symporter